MTGTTDPHRIVLTVACGFSRIDGSPSAPMGVSYSGPGSFSESLRCQAVIVISPSRTMSAEVGNEDGSSPSSAATMILAAESGPSPLPMAFHEMFATALSPGARVISAGPGSSTMKELPGAMLTGKGSPSAFS